MLRPGSPSCVVTTTSLPPASELPPANLSGCAVALAHELGHASEGEEDEEDGDGDNVGRYENPVRYDLGIPPRRSNHDWPVWPIWPPY